ncbi:MAG TPA: NUDIX domain-containing protein [Rhizomicrobium sp.]|nr:NUDIX domain-containing protein [Rhizomicrobium sp.]
MVTIPLQPPQKSDWSERSLLLNLAVAARLAAQAVLAPVAYGAHGLIEDDTGRLLLVRHTYFPGWHLPGGGVQRGEPAHAAVLRELNEEIGLTSAQSCTLFGLYTRKHLWATNVIALFHLNGADFTFSPNAEIAEAKFFTPDAPPKDIGPGAHRRFLEHTQKTEKSLYW